MTLTLALPGLEAPKGGTPASRLRALRSLRDDELEHRLATLARRLRDALPSAAAKRLAALAGLPVGEVIASPFATRMVALGVLTGATTVLSELRAPMVSATFDGRTRAVEHGAYARGHRLAGKYEQFRLDEPVAVYRAQHSSKWGPHELMHRAAGYAYRVGASRFERYLSARLNELLPVVTFYGHEQTMRLDEGAFDRASAGRLLAAEPKRARHRTASGAALRALARRSLPVFREGLSHYERELAAVDVELASGFRAAAPHPQLDTSSDALAYVVGEGELGVAHANLRATFAATHDVGAFRDRIEALHDVLLFGTIELDAMAIERAQREVERRDLALRALGLPRDLRGPVGRLLADVDGVAALDAEDDPRLTRFLATGQRGRRRSIDHAGFEEAIHGTSPTLARLGDPPELARVLASQPALLARATLPARLERALRELGVGVLADAAKLDAALARRSFDDPAFELSSPTLDAETAVTRSDAFELLELDHDVVAAGRTRPSPCFVGQVRGKPLVVPLARPEARAFRALGARSTTVDGLVRRLRDAGVRNASARVRTLHAAGVLIAGKRPENNDS